MPKLHGHPLSPFVRKVRIAMAEKAIDYENDPVVHFALPDGFERLHPLRKIPVLTTDGGENIPDSSVILSYLDRTAPNPLLTPEDPVLAARALFLEEFADSALSMAIAAVFLEKFATPMFFEREPDEARIDRAMSEDLPPLFSHLNTTLANSEFLVGDTFTVADVAVGSPLCNFRHAGNEVDKSTYPNLRRYADALLARPSIKAIFTAEVAEYGGNSPEALAKSA